MQLLINRSEGGKNEKGMDYGYSGRFCHWPSGLLDQG